MMREPGSARAGRGVPIAFCGRARTGLCRRVPLGSRTVARLVRVGTLGFVLLASADSPLAFGVGAVLAFGAGWGWTGVFDLAVVIENRDAPATATCFAQTGALPGFGTESARLWGGGRDGVLHRGLGVLGPPRRGQC